MMDIKLLRRKDKILKKAAMMLNCEPEQLPAIIAKFKSEIENIETEIKRLKR